MRRLDQIQDYLGNRLSASELEEFELELLSNGELQAEVETHLKLKRAMRSASQEDMAVPIELLAQHPTVITVETMRGSEQIVELGVEPTLLAVDVGPGGGEEFQVEIRHRDEVRAQERLLADDEGYLNVLVSDLLPGDYRCEIQSPRLTKTLQLVVNK